MKKNLRRAPYSVQWRSHSPIQQRFIAQTMYCSTPAGNSPGFGNLRMRHTLNFAQQEACMTQR